MTSIVKNAFRRQIPGPANRFPFGVLFEYSPNPLAYALKASTQYGQIFKLPFGVFNVNLKLGTRVRITKGKTNISYSNPNEIMPLLERLGVRGF